MLPLIKSLLNIAFIVGIIFIVHYFNLYGVFLAFGMMWILSLQIKILREISKNAPAENVDYGKLGEVMQGLVKK